MIIAVGIYIVTVFTLIIIGTMRHDIRSIRVAAAFRRHPYARKWRNRPIVTIIGGTLTQKHTYRKIRIGDPSPELPPSNEVAAFIPQHVTISKLAISNAITVFNGSVSTTAVECYPIVQPARTIKDLFAMYYIFATSPFVAVRSGLGVITPDTGRPVISKHGPLMIGYADAVYLFFSWITKWINLFVFLSSLYLALILGHSGLFIIYLSGFSLWLSWAIVTYPDLPIKHKVGYLLLLPVSFVHFLYLILLAPLRVGSLVSAIMHRPQNAKIEL